MAVLIDFIVLTVLIVFIIWFFQLRPKIKSEKKRQKSLKSLKINDDIITIGGFKGTIMEFKKEIIVIEVDTGVEIEIYEAAFEEKITEKNT